MVIFDGYVQYDSTKSLLSPTNFSHSVLALQFISELDDIGFELVAQPDGATIYLMDHDKPMASKGITGKLTVLQGSNKIEADIKEAGDNTLRVLGVKLGKGDKLVAALSNVGGKSMTVRFTIK